MTWTRISFVSPLYHTVLATRAIIHDDHSLPFSLHARRVLQLYAQGVRTESECAVSNVRSSQVNTVREFDTDGSETP